MASEKDKFDSPITLEYVNLNYSEFAKVLFINYASIDENVRALAALEFLKHYFFNTSETEIELFKKRNPNAGMIFDILDAASEQRQCDARWSSWTREYKQREGMSIEDLMIEKQQEKKERKKIANKKQRDKKKQNKESYEEIKAKREKEAKDNLKEFAEEHDIDIDINY